MSGFKTLLKCIGFYIKMSENCFSFFPFFLFFFFFWLPTIISQILFPLSELPALPGCFELNCFQSEVVLTT